MFEKFKIKKELKEIFKSMDNDYEYWTFNFPEEDYIRVPKLINKINNIVIEIRNYNNNYTEFKAELFINDRECNSNLNSKELKRLKKHALKLIKRIKPDANNPFYGVKIKTKENSPEDFI